MITDRIEPAVINTVSQRIDVLENVREEPMDKRTLEDRLSVSRSTIDRAVRELEALDLIEYADGAYRITTCGRLAARKYREFERVIRLLAEFRPFLRHVPESRFGLDVSHLADAELFVPEPGAPYAMVDRHVQVVKNMERGRGMLPIAGLHAHEAAHEAIVDEGADGELVVEPEVADTLRSKPRYAELTEEMVTTGRLEIFVYDGDIPYFLGVFDEEAVQIGVDENGEPRALVETDSAEVRAWARDTIAEYKKEARKLC